MKPILSSKFKVQSFVSNKIKKTAAIATLFFLTNYTMQAQSPTVTLTPSQHNGYNITCFGKTDGSITANVTGGMPPYTYAWTNDQTTQTISNLAAGYYSVRVTDAALHEVDADITLTEPELLELQAAVFTYPNGYNVSLYNAYNGSITVTVNGGVANYNLLWNDGNTSQNRTALGASSYRVTVTDANGCVANIEQLILTQPERSDWTMTGNANTNPATNFIGTTDLKDLVFKTNNLERLKINANGDLKINALVGKEGVLNVDANGNLQSANADGVLVPCGTPVSYFKGFNNPLTIFSCLPVKVGIGTAIPKSLTDISGNLSIGLNYAGQYAAPANGMIVEGQVGIGTHNVDPDIKLTVASTTNAIACIGTSNPASISALWVKNFNGWYAFKTNANGVGQIVTISGFLETPIINYTSDGRVGIGTMPQIANDYRLVVEGKIGAREINVKATGAWPDYVFDEGYKLMPLPQLKKYIEQNNHLPQLPSATTIEKDGGFDLGKMQQLHLMKTEELYLYMFQMMKRIDELEAKITVLEKNK